MTRGSQAAQFGSFAWRAQRARALIEALFGDFEQTVKAIVADGWPAPMVRAGLALHRHTWDIDALIEALERELYPIGGLAALEGFRPLGDQSGLVHVVKPKKVVHLWPALPGTGLTPVLLGLLLGCEQVVRPSSRTSYFAQHLWQCWQRVGADALMCLEYDAPNPSWRSADVVVVSGRDDTLDAVSGFIGHPRHRQRPVLMGYGHKVSAAVIVDDGTAQTMALASSVALDAVMWHQRGCFSARGVIFCGSAPRAQAFAQRLGAAIAQVERELQATTLPEAELIKRAQARGVAEFQGELFGDGVGWVQWDDGAFRGVSASPHVLTFHHIEQMSQLAQMFALPAKQLQGCALGMAGAELASRRSWALALAQLGFTRICQPGQLQSPPAGWLHDGWPNVLDWVRVCTMDL